jgi:hypothetical protein
MFDRIFKTILIVLAVSAVFLLWLGLDDMDGYDDPNVVTIDYECDKLNDYQAVPKEVIEECQLRDKNGN